MKTPLERKQRARTLEKEIHAAAAAKHKAALKLKEIRDDGLYKEDGFDTFKAYCWDRFEWSEKEANELIRNAEHLQAVIEATNETGK